MPSDRHTSYGPRYPMVNEYVLLLIVLFQLIIGGNGSPDAHGTVLYKLTDINRKTWTHADRMELQIRKSVGLLIPGTNFSDGERFLEYFDAIKGEAKKIVSSVARKRTMILVVDALGGYLHAKLLPRVKQQYYAGRATYSTVKRLHDLDKTIKYIMGTDGRGWARPMMSDQQSDEDGSSMVWRAAERQPRSTVRTSDDDLSAESCGGVDVSRYGLLRQVRPTKTAAGAADVEEAFTDLVPLFDNDTRPHSLVVPWRQGGKSVLYSVRNRGCHQTLFDYLTTATVANMRSRRATLRQWLDEAVLPLVTARATDRWYPALWGATLAARRLKQVDVAHRIGTRGHHQMDCDLTTTEVPGHNFYAAIVLMSASVCWSVALYIAIGGKYFNFHCIP